MHPPPSRIRVCRAHEWKDCCSMQFYMYTRLWWHKSYGFRKYLGFSQRHHIVCAMSWSRWHVTKLYVLYIVMQITKFYSLYSRYQWRIYKWMGGLHPLLSQKCTKGHILSYLGLNPLQTRLHYCKSTKWKYESSEAAGYTPQRHFPFKNV